MKPYEWIDDPPSICTYDTTFELVQNEDIRGYQPYAMWGPRPDEFVYS